MEDTMTEQRIGTLTTESFGAAGGGSRPKDVTLKNDGFWENPGWLAGGQRYSLRLDDQGWRVTCTGWHDYLNDHTWRLADDDGDLIDALPLDSGAFDLDPAETYDIAEHDDVWALFQVTAEAVHE